MQHVFGTRLMGTVATDGKSTGPSPLPDGVENYGAFQRRFWAVQRVAWVVFSLILLACLLGLMGRGGLFSTKVMQSAGGTIEIPAISRWNAPDDMRVSLPPSAMDQTVFVDPRFLDAFSIDGVDPPQKTTVRKDGRIGYVFGSDAITPARIVFRLQTQQPGLRSFLVGIEDDVAEHSTFILP
jgi:protein-L-isoaspartate(D-aspartate) O-methyltransferase